MSTLRTSTDQYWSWYHLGHRPGRCFLAAAKVHCTILGPQPACRQSSRARVDGFAGAGASAYCGDVLAQSHATPVFRIPRELVWPGLWLRSCEKKHSNFFHFDFSFVLGTKQTIHGKPAEASTLRFCEVPAAEQFRVDSWCHHLASKAYQV